MKVKLGTQYYWKGMKAAVERVVRCCIRCQKNRRRKNLPKPPLKPMVYQRLLECIQIDLTFLKEDRGYIGVLRSLTAAPSTSGPTPFDPREQDQ
jgi:hypothetical protein